MAKKIYIIFAVFFFIVSFFNLVTGKAIAAVTADLDISPNPAVADQEVNITVFADDSEILRINLIIKGERVDSYDCNNTERQRCWHSFPRKFDTVGKYKITGEIISSQFPGITNTPEKILNVVAAAPTPTPAPTPWQSRTCPPNTICNPLKANNFDDLVNYLIKFAFYIALAIAPLMIIYAGFLWITSAGEAAKIQTAQKIILYTSIGLGIILLARGLIAIIKSALGG